LDWTGGQIKNNDSADDVRDVDLKQVHYLSGPFAVPGTEPGDVLVVEICNAGPLEGDEWGFTGIFARENGGGFLTDHYPNAAKAIWEFEGIFAKSRHIPGVRFPGLIHPGIIGTAPSRELLDKWNKREKELFDTDPHRVPTLACLPDTTSSLVGKAEGTELGERIKREGARTVPPREHGGNVDIKNLSIGSKIYLPVYVEGANFSVGDMHFSEGDGEISFCGAIEMSGFLDLKVSVIKDGISKFNMKNPIFFPGPIEPHFRKYLTFQGISVDEHGKQHYLDAHVSYRQACLNAIEYLKRFGYTGEQAYLLMSASPCEGHIAGIVDVPNACCTLGIPVDIFDFDISPEAEPKMQNEREWKNDIQ
jgi:formamidase